MNLDPLFSDASNADYTLNSASPCIDMGTADINMDGIDDIQDFFGIAPDIGVFEFEEDELPLFSQESVLPN